MTVQTAWEERYRKGETGWDRGAPSPATQDWMGHPGRKPCRLLVPGCGFGHEVIEFARHGFDVTAVDIAPSAIRYLEAKLLGSSLAVETVCADLFDFEPDMPFDAVYEQTCMCAISPEQRIEYVKCLYRWLVPGGHLLAMFMQTGKEGGPPWHWQESPPTLIPHRNGLFELAFQLERT